ncbi:histidine kinase [Fluviicola sp.]|uniref:histidine kinase n=1 Tax=Fluviicola sp. TaxID=1917219 RepID=UPI003D2846A4
MNLGIAFSARNEYEKAIIYLKKGTFYLHKSNAKRWYCSCWLELSEIYISIKNQKKARFYLKKASKCISSEYENSNLNFLYAQYYKNMSEFDQAKTYLQKSIAIDSIMNQSKLGEDYLVMAELSIAAKNYGEAEKQLKNAVTIFKINHEEENLKSAYHLLIKNFLYTSKSDEHLTYFNEYMKLSEKIDHINNSKALLDLDKKYKTAEKESQIKSQQIQIQKDETIKLITFGVFGFSLLLVGSGFIWYNNRQKRKKLELQNKLLGMNQSLSMMELSVLNKQLDPHEIKNILASISPEIQEKAPDAYLRMLKLLNLIKASLNSNSFTESIENQIQQSKDYLFLENSMLEKSIALSIDLKIENKEFQIPRLLLKNLVENAIKHGLKNKKHDKAIQLLLEENESMVSIKVIDNGTWLDNTNHTISGIGISTYIKLFELLNRKNSQNASFNIDLEDNKTCVSVSIPKNYSWL